MNPIDPFEDRLPAALTDLAQPLTSDYLPGLLVRTRRVRQRPAWTFPERWIPMTVITRRASPSTLGGLRVALGLAAALLLALILAAGMLLATGSAPPPLVISPHNGLIAYSLDGDIWLADADGGSPRVLVGGPTQDVGPWWSRDGSRLLFVRVVDGGEELRIVDGPGELKLLTPEPVVGMTWFDWSPDGSQVVISWDADGDGVASLGLLAADGGGRFTPLETGMPATSPSFHPDGSRILFRGVEDGVPGLYTVPVSGGEVSGPLTTSDTSTAVYAEYRGEHDLLDPAWSPDGTRISYLRLDPVPAAELDGNGWRLYVMNADGTEDRRLEVSPESDDEWLPSWSPDGTRIGLQVLDADVTQRKDLGRRANHVAIVSPDGSADSHLFGPIAYQTNPGDPNAVAFLWSPDSTTILAAESGQPSTLIDVTTGASTTLPWAATDGWSWQPLFDD
jgi:dipeptidyl aminopeptidase/acylaminoacyl peptidase